MRTLGEIIDLVATTVNKTDAASMTAYRKFCRQRANYIYDLCLWKSSLYLKSIPVTAGNAQVIFPKHTELVIAIRYDELTILPSNQEYLFMSNPGLFDDSATPVTYTEARPVATEVAPADELLKFKSSDGGDVGIKVKIVGELAGVQQREKISMNGTSDVLTAKSYDTVYSIGKDKAQDAVGDFTVTGNTSAVALVTIPFELYTVSCPRIQLEPIPDTDVDMLVLFKRTADQMIDDSDVPPLTHMEDALISYTLGDAQRRRRQWAKAKDAYAEADVMVAKMKAVHEYQKASLPRMVPMPTLMQSASRRRQRVPFAFSGKPL